MRMAIRDSFLSLRPEFHHSHSHSFHSPTHSRNLTPNSPILIPFPFSNHSGMATFESRCVKAGGAKFCIFISFCARFCCRTRHAEWPLLDQKLKTFCFSQLFIRSWRSGRSRIPSWRPRSYLLRIVRLPATLVPPELETHSRHSREWSFSRMVHSRKFRQIPPFSFSFSPFANGEPSFSRMVHSQVHSPFTNHSRMDAHAEYYLIMPPHSC